MQCPYCQQQLPDDARFCGACGNNVDISTQITSSEAAPPAVDTPVTAIRTAARSIPMIVATVALMIVSIINIFAPHIVVGLAAEGVAFVRVFSYAAATDVDWDEFSEGFDEFIDMRDEMYDQVDDYLDEEISESKQFLNIFTRTIPTIMMLTGLVITCASCFVKTSKFPTLGPMLIMITAITQAVVLAIDFVHGLIEYWPDLSDISLDMPFILILWVIIQIALLIAVLQLCAVRLSVVAYRSLKRSLKPPTVSGNGAMMVLICFGIIMGVLVISSFITYNFYSILYYGAATTMMFAFAVVIEHYMHIAKIALYQHDYTNK